MSIPKRYRPISALQAMFSVYLGVFSVCLQNLIWACSILLLSKWVLYDKSSGPHISHPHSSTGLTRPSKSLSLIVIVVVSESENKSILTPYSFKSELSMHFINLYYVLLLIAIFQCFCYLVVYLIYIFFFFFCLRIICSVMYFLN